MAIINNLNRNVFGTFKDLGSGICEFIEIILIAECKVVDTF